VLLGGREDVEDAAPHREVASLLDEVGPGVAGGHQFDDDVGELAAVVAGVQFDRDEVAEVRDLRLQ
jgi:hypothetical protein